MITMIPGDCIASMKTLQPHSVDLILVDPPYGITACGWDSVIDFKDMWTEIKRIRKPNGVTAIFGSEPFASHLRISNIDEFKYDWLWSKNRRTGHLQAKRQPLKAHETISIFYSQPPKYNPQKTTGHRPTHAARGDGYSPTLGKTKLNHYKGGDTTRYPISILEFKCERGFHPTQKPVDLCKYLIKTYTDERQCVLDFTMGSGSTGVAARDLKRQFIGIENNQKYFDIAVRRIFSQSTTLQG